MKRIADSCVVYVFRHHRETKRSDIFTYRSVKMIADLEALIGSLRVQFKWFDEPLYARARPDYFSICLSGYDLLVYVHRVEENKILIFLRGQTGELLNDGSILSRDQTNSRHISHYHYYYNGRLGRCDELNAIHHTTDQLRHLYDEITGRTSFEIERENCDIWESRTIRKRMPYSINYHTLW